VSKDPSQRREETALDGAKTGAFLAGVGVLIGFGVTYLATHGFPAISIPLPGKRVEMTPTEEREPEKEPYPENQGADVFPLVPPIGGPIPPAAVDDGVVLPGGMNGYGYGPFGPDLLTEEDRAAREAQDNLHAAVRMQMETGRSLDWMGEPANLEEM
jgi:hypothetical protein